MTTTPALNRRITRSIVSWWIDDVDLRQKLIERAG